MITVYDAADGVSEASLAEFEEGNEIRFRMQAAGDDAVEYSGTVEEKERTEAGGVNLDIRAAERLVIGSAIELLILLKYPGGHPAISVEAHNGRVEKLEVEKLEGEDTS